jgi:small subunit ribosomal protein S6
MANRAYEALLILDPTLDDDAVAATITKLDDGIKKLGGSIEKNEKQGRKKLAFTVKKKNEGVYILTHLQLDPQQINELNRLYKLNENTLRHMVTAR